MNNKKQKPKSTIVFDGREWSPTEIFVIANRNKILRQALKRIKKYVESRCKDRPEVLKQSETWNIACEALGMTKGVK